jgi:ATP-dependent DNA helicase RecG
MKKNLEFDGLIDESAKEDLIRLFSEITQCKTDEIYITLDIAKAFPQNESRDMAFKSAAGEFPEDFWKTYSAFANTQGGIIILGVSEKKGKLSFDGLSSEQIHQYQKHFWKNANKPNVVSVNLLQKSDIKVITFEGVQLLAFSIPMADRTQKPVYLNKKPIDQSYLRKQKANHQCNENEVRRMMADADQELFQDSRILEGFDFNDLDMDSLIKYRQLFTQLNPSNPWLSLSNKDFLEKLGVYRIDSSTKQERLTLAALLMFGKYSSIVKPECVPHFFPVYRVHLSVIETDSWNDRIYPDGTWECNLLNFYWKIFPELISGLPLSSDILDECKIKKTPTNIALQEAFINALIHTDYSAPGLIVIDRYEDRYQFSNPGALLISSSQYFRGIKSICRNPSLQRMFNLICTYEKVDSGINIIMKGWESERWRMPILHIEDQPERFKLEMVMRSVFPENIRNELINNFGVAFKKLNQHKQVILLLCANEGKISNYRLQYLLHLRRTNITAMLQQLCKQGFLVSKNKGRWTTYLLNYAFQKESS